MKLLGKSVAFSFLLLFLTYFFSLPAFASNPVDVTDIRYWSFPEYTRVVISLTDQVEFSKKRLSNPDRLYFDLKNSRINTEIKKNISVSNEMLKSVRASQFDAGTVRVVLDLEKITDYKIVTLEDPVRLVIDIYGKTIISPFCKKEDCHRCRPWGTRPGGCRTQKSI